MVSAAVAHSGKGFTKWRGEGCEEIAVSAAPLVPPPPAGFAPSAPLERLRRAIRVAYGYPSSGPLPPRDIACLPVGSTSGGSVSLFLSDGVDRVMEDVAADVAEITGTRISYAMSHPQGTDFVGSTEGTRAARGMHSVIYGTLRVEVAMHAMSIAGIRSASERVDAFAAGFASRLSSILRGMAGLSSSRPSGVPGILSREMERDHAAGVAAASGMDLTVLAA